MCLLEEKNRDVYVYVLFGNDDHVIRNSRWWCPGLPGIKIKKHVRHYMSFVVYELHIIIFFFLNNIRSNWGSKTPKHRPWKFWVYVLIILKQNLQNCTWEATERTTFNIFFSRTKHDIVSESFGWRGPHKVQAVFY